MARAKNSGSANASPWQVKGVSHETREAIRQAARKAGLPIGEWTDRVLHRAAIEELTGSNNLPAKIEDSVQEILDRLGSIEDYQRQSWWRRLTSRSQNSPE